MIESDDIVFLAFLAIGFIYVLWLNSNCYKKKVKSAIHKRDKRALVRVISSNPGKINSSIDAV